MYRDVRFVQVKSNNKPTREWIERATAWRSGGAIKEYVIYKDYSRGNAPTKRVTL